ncbi:DUF1353 domain-containing protein [Bradyrhizobium sp. CCGE-LA001]|uniref:DUF1353 domain-containing protein n=1 Tax=Bradyrhizobium sp. CCGE-LA001 TaxID=1223566 RepID=UPI0002AA7E16|nr:DUF1353 domain-containing protein [Bradyrhizobium sp. CCGE-LA001]
MNEKDLARAVAADLGPEVLASLDGPASDGRTRTFGITEAMAIGGFLVQCAQLALEIWRAREDRAVLPATLVNNDELMSAYPRLDPEKRLGLIARVLNKLLPDSFGRPTHDRSGDGSSDKRQWVASYSANRGGPTNPSARTFHGGATILLPFGDQNWWVVYRAIGWLPDASDGPGVVRVDVPQGFVTDLASVPNYLWAVLQKTGRYGNAAIYHDYLYWEQQCSREVADRVFDRAMVEMDVDSITRNLIWAGVRVFGSSAWKENAAEKARGGKRVVKRFPNGPTMTWDEWRKQPDVFA